MIRDGKYNGQIFESKGAVITTCGSLTVIARKTSPERIFNDAHTLLRAGYYCISTEKEGLIEDEETKKMIMELVRGLPENLKVEIMASLNEKTSSEV
jgi:hypothetical protein